jgi:hypothetical protein
MILLLEIREYPLGILAGPADDGREGQVVGIIGLPGSS